MDLKIRTNEWVEVKSFEEIARTLGEDGTLDGLPFMPEMAEFCGGRFQVERRAGKVCVEYPGGKYRMRKFRNDDVAILKIPRCSGSNHDGCQRACVMFWKTAWLRKAAIAGAVSAIKRVVREKLAGLKTRTEAGAYLCQSTEMQRATLPLSRAGVLWECLEDLQSGSRGFLEMVRMVLLPIWRVAWGPFRKPLRVGTLTKTPVGTLNLQPGELVRIKTEDEILKTLDTRYRNRGLTCDRGMREFCGGTYRVRNRLDRLISESSAQMRKVESTVMLDGLQCICEYNHVGGCPRQDLMYWREIWLERATPGPEPSSAPAESLQGSGKV